MKQIGGLLVLFGAGSFVLNMMEREFSLTMWVDNWGPTTGNAIRGGMIVVGALLWIVGNKKKPA